MTSFGLEVRPAAPAAILARTMHRFVTRFAAERDRWVLWTPVLIAIGIAVYFALPLEPGWWLGAAMVATALLGRLVLPRTVRPAATLLALVALGFAVAQARTAMVGTPLLVDQTRPVRVEGVVEAIDLLEKSTRILLVSPRIPGLEPAATPYRVRILLKPGTAPPTPGERVSVLAILRPPPDPAAPGAYDFRRHAYFAGIGGVGFALGTPARLGAGEGERSALGTWLESLRAGIAERVGAHLSGATGAVAVALLNGEQTAIPATDLEAMRISGLQHLLSISGLHIGLVAGLVFLVLRGGLALVEPVALRWPIKKWAAVGAMLAATAYTLLVGAPVPTQRALLMTGVMLLAVLFDRSPFSMRVIAFAATLMLLTQPEALLGPSFQMSFAAVLALIAVYEVLSPRLAEWRAGSGPIRKGALYIAGVALTSLVAGAATTPFTLYHFQQMANYGVLANLIAVPLTSFLVMPAGLLAFMLMLFGLEGPALSIMGLGIDGILWTAHWVAAMPGASFIVAAMPDQVLVAIVLGGVWLALWRGPWRLLGLPALLVAAVALVAPDRPDVLVASSGKLVAVRLADGTLAVSNGRAARFEAEVWNRRDGREGLPPKWPKKGTRDGRLACEAGGCLYQLGAHRVAIVNDVAWIGTACSSADLVIAGSRPGACPDTPVIDSAALSDKGAHAIHLDGDGRLRVETARAGRGARPWN